MQEVSLLTKKTVHAQVDGSTVNGALYTHKSRLIPGVV